MDRKKKLRIIQTTLLFVSLIIIFFTYFSNKKNYDEKIISADIQKKLNEQVKDKNSDRDIFFNIEYSGLDFSGNRFILKSKEAYTNKSSNELINMKSVNAVFYFKDNTILYVKSDNGVYNNKTLDIEFTDNIEAKYEESKLFADYAKYTNLESFLKVSKNVKVNDPRGTMNADELLFDINTKKLNISSFDDDKINANLNIK